MLSGSSAIWMSQFPNLRRHLSKKTPVKEDTCQMLLGLVLANSHVFTEFDDMKNLQRGLFIIDAAVMLALEPLGMTIYIYDTK